MAALSAALDGPASKGFVVRADGLARFRYNWDGTTVQFYLLPKPGGKVSLVVVNSKLPGAAMVEERREQWRIALRALATLLAGSVRTGIPRRQPDSDSYPRRGRDRTSGSAS